MKFVCVGSWFYAHNGRKLCIFSLCFLLLITLMTSLFWKLYTFVIRWLLNRFPFLPLFHKCIKWNEWNSGIYSKRRFEYAFNRERGNNLFQSILTVSKKRVISVSAFSCSLIKREMNWMIESTKNPIDFSTNKQFSIKHLKFKALKMSVFLLKK